MKIYVSHSKNFDYKNELYNPLKTLKHDLILPHEFSKEVFNSKESLRSVDLVIAEVSIPSISVGIELGWADSYSKRIICVHKKGSKMPGSLKNISKEFIEYADSNDLINKLITSSLLHQ